MSLRPSITGIELAQLTGLFGSKDRETLEEVAKKMAASNGTRFVAAFTSDLLGRTRDIPKEEIEEEDGKELQKIARAARAIIMGDVQPRNGEGSDEEGFFTKIFNAIIEFLEKGTKIRPRGIAAVWQWPIKVLSIAALILFILFLVIISLPRIPFLLAEKKKKQSTTEDSAFIQAIGYLSELQEHLVPQNDMSVWKHQVFSHYRAHCKKIDPAIKKLLAYMEEGRPIFAKTFDTDWEYYAYLRHNEAKTLLEYLKKNPIMASDPDGFGPSLTAVLDEIVAAKKDLWLFAS